MAQQCFLEHLGVSQLLLQVLVDSLKFLLPRIAGECVLGL